MVRINQSHVKQKCIFVVVFRKLQICTISPQTRTHDNSFLREKTDGAMSLKWVGRGKIIEN